MTPLIRVLLVLLLIHAVAPQVQAKDGRYLQLFNSGWKFTLGDNPAYAEISFDDNSWRSLELPHDWSIEGEINKDNPALGNGGYYPCGIGWYRKTFQVADSLKGKRVFIRFDGVYMNSSVWLNGRKLGTVPNGYAAFQYDLTNMIKIGKDNVIAVKVDNSLQPNSRWYSGSGIYRNVHLLITNPLHFTPDGIFVSTTEANSSNATLNIKYKVRSNIFKESKISPLEKDPAKVIKTEKNCTIISTLYDNNGNQVTMNKADFKIHDLISRETETKLTLSNPQLWSDDKPTLYRLESVLECEGEEVDCVETNVGIRDIQFTADHGMLVNGKQVKIKGVCLHHEAGSFGAAVPIEVWQFRLEKLKSMGCNGIRTSHCPFAPEFYDLCDRMGFYVLEDAFDEWRWGYDLQPSEDASGKRTYAYHLYFDQWAETDLRGMITHDRNHPSIVMYCLGNEMPDQRYEDGTETFKKLKKITRDCDPTRPVTAACDFSGVANTVGFMDVADIAGYNYIDRYDKPDLYAAEKQKYPNRKYIGTETYSHPRCWIGIKDKPYVIGEYIWSGYDYLGESINWPLKGWNWGFLDLASFEKPEFYNRKSFWSDEPMVYIAVERKELPSYEKKDFDWRAFNVVSHWNWENDGRKTLPVKIFSNCDEVVLYLNGKRIGKEKPDQYHVASFDVKYIPGLLKAVGIKNGKKTAEYYLATAGEATQLISGPQWISNNIVQFQIKAVDKKQNPVHLANNGIVVEVIKGGKLIGLDTGDQTSHELYKTNHCKLFEGRASVIVELTGIEGAFVKITSPGLKGTQFAIGPH
jgi:beta-galactosidase